MKNEKEKTTIPIPSVGADGEQSLSYVTDEIIAIKNEEINPTDENMEEIEAKNLVWTMSCKLQCCCYIDPELWIDTVHLPWCEYKKYL